MRWKLVWLTVLMFAGAVASAQAAFAPRISPATTERGAEVRINGRTALRFRASNGNLGPGERASITADRITQLVSAGVDPRGVFAKGDKWMGKVCAAGVVMCTATTADARAARTSPLALAQSWAANIRSLLVMPPIVLSDRTVTVPFGETRRVTVGGAATGPIYVKAMDPAVASATVNPDTRQITVTGLQTGYSVVDVVSEGEKASFDVYVKKYAGSVPPSVFGEVTGSPCPESLVKYAAVQSVLRAAVTEPGAKVEVEKLDGAENALGQGAVRKARAKVRITGPDYLTWVGESVAEVHNSVMPREQVRQLFYSNNPERLLKFQTLFTGKLESGVSTRLLYHHQNAAGKRARLIVEIINPQPYPASFRVVKGVSRPMVDTVLVGYVASLDFLKDQQSNSSVIERIPAQSRLVLVSDLLDNLQTSSGILQIRQMDGSGAFVRVADVPPGVDDAPPGAIGTVTDAPALDLSQHVYSTAAKSVEADYVIGQRWAFIPIGKHAVQSNDEQVKLYGNYGVTYDINVRVENPTAETKKVRVVFDPTAGLASGVFIIDGTFVSAKYAKPPAEIPLASYELKPGETRKVNIVTLPVAGSNYPATLVVRS